MATNTIVPIHHTPEALADPISAAWVSYRSLVKQGVDSGPELKLAEGILRNKEATSLGALEARLLAVLELSPDEWVDSVTTGDAVEPDSEQLRKGEWVAGALWRAVLDVRQMRERQKIETRTLSRERDNLGVAFEQIAAMVDTLDASQLLDHPADHKAILTAGTMFSVIVDKVHSTRAALYANAEQVAA